jgi:hypothetical protein
MEAVDSGRNGSLMSSDVGMVDLIPVSRRTPASLRRAIAAGNATEIHQMWCEQLKKPRKRWLRRRDTVTPVSLWSVDDLELSGRERELAVSIEDQLVSVRGRKKGVHRREARADRKHRSETSIYGEILSNWLIEADSPPGIWESLVISEILLTDMPDIPAETFVRCIGLLAGASEKMLAMRDDTSFSADTSDPVGTFAKTHTSETGCRLEAAWEISLLLSPLERTGGERQTAAGELCRTLLECTGPDGFPHGSLLCQLNEFLIPLIRGAMWSDAFRQSLWDEQARVRFRQTVEICSMLLLPDGRMLPLSASEGAPSEETPAEGVPSEIMPAILTQAARLAGFKQGSKIRKLSEQSGDRQLRKDRRQRLKLIRGGSVAKKKSDATVSWQSDVSCTALMRSAPTPLADLLVMEWHSALPVLSAAPFGLPLLNGAWTWKLQVGEQELSMKASWNCTCWFLDGEVVFAELEAQDIPGVRLIRHVLLSTTDHFAVLTDTVTCEQPESIVKLSTTIPLVSGILTERDAVTREVLLHLSDFPVRAFPTWLPDDRIEYAHGRFAEENGLLVSENTGKGGTMLSLILDWHPARKSLPADWCRLTVAEARRNVSDREACAARLRIGQHQLLVYRSLMIPQANRTVMGLHTADESYYGRIPKSGIAESLVQVEMPASETSDS